MLRLPSWFPLGLTAVAVPVGILFLAAGESTIVEVPASDKTMRPALGDRTSFKVDTSWLARPSRGDIVAFVPPGRSGHARLARVAAVAGDRLEVRGGELHVNGKPVVKGRELPEHTVPEFLCPRECVYLTADAHEKGAQDSVGLGPVPLWRVLGSVTP